MQSLRVDNQTVRTFLDRLDRGVRPPTGIDLRAWPRFDYRVGSLHVELSQGEEALASHAVAARNLSREGIAFLAGQFVYSGTACQVTLRSLHGHDQMIPGHVVRCRYLVGSGSLHEVGVRFDRPIDVELFAPDARVHRVLFVDDSPSMHNLVAHFLEPLNAELMCATTAAEAAHAALASEFELILLDLESNAFNAFDVTKQLRRAGYLGPIVGLAVQTGRMLREKCEAAGCTGYLPKPVTRGGLRRLLESLQSDPVLSSVADEPGMAPLINEFVASLRQRARRISRAFEKGNVDRVHDLAQELRADAGSYGFDVITEEAEHLQALAALAAPAARLRVVLYDLIHLCLAARPAACPEDDVSTTRGGPWWSTTRPPST